MPWVASSHPTCTSLPLTSPPPQALVTPQAQVPELEAGSLGPWPPPAPLWASHLLGKRSPFSPPTLPGIFHAADPTSDTFSSLPSPPLRPLTPQLFSQLCLLHRPSTRARGCPASRAPGGRAGPPHLRPQSSGAAASSGRGGKRHLTGSRVPNLDPQPLTPVCGSDPNQGHSFTFSWTLTVCPGSFWG